MSAQPVLRDLNKLLTFVRVAEHKSFTRAAEDLRTTPSVVSKHVKELEDALGFVVLNRSTHGVALTEYGEGLLQHCRQILGQLDGFIIDARMSQKLPQGTLRLQTIGDYPGVFAGLVVARYFRRMPTLKLQHVGTCDPTQGIDEGADVILTIKRLSAPGFHEVDLGEVRHVVCASPDYLAAKGRPTDPRTLREHNCIADLRAPSREWPFAAGGQNLLLEVSGTILSNGQGMACRAAVDGLGVARVPAKLVEGDLATGRLEALLTDSVASPERLFAYYSNARALPRKTSEFLADMRLCSTAGAG